MPSPPNSGRRRQVVRYEAQPTRMFGSYSVTAHYDDHSVEALKYGEPHFCIGEAKRLNTLLAAESLPGGTVDGGRSAARSNGRLIE